VLLINYGELFVLLSKQWANVNDIQKISNRCKDKSREIRNEITKEILASGKRLPNGKSKIVPMTKIIEYFDLDIDFIFKMAMSEKELKNKF